ncbi:MAG: C40 family peptidase [Clostridia bacterium]|nr:C40 family peptidase [Clostridia bacterium]
MIKKGKLFVSSIVAASLITLFSSSVFAEGKFGTVTGDNLNIRKSPSTSGDVVTSFAKGIKVKILDSADGWYKVTCDNMTGWAKRDFISVTGSSSTGSSTKSSSTKSSTTSSSTTRKGSLNTDGVNVRAKANLKAEVVASLEKGSTVSIVSYSDGWYKVKTSDGTIGWIFADFINVKSTKVSRSVQVPSVKTTPSKSTKSTKIDTSTGGKDMISYSKKFLGVRYVYGGSSPKGFDCSGFTQYVFRKYGISINRVAADQAKQGKKVKRSELKSGDLVFFDTNGGHNYINHVGLYIGNGKFIHASSGSRYKVVISEMAGFYDDAYMTARRFIN